MQQASIDAFLKSEENFPPNQIAALAELYDRFAHALDPFSPDRDRAEQTFQQSIAEWYDRIEGAKPPLVNFRKAVVLRCIRHLNATEKPKGI